MKRAALEKLPLHGEVAPGFEPVREIFLENFRERDEIGAACTVFHKGEKIIDLWGGWRDPKRRHPWEADTMAVVYSTTKGLAAMTLALAHSRGWIDFDARVAKYWPEFAQHGKEKITVRQLLAHQAGLCAVDEPLTLDVLANPDRLAAILAQQKPAWEPGARQGYHAVSLGFYESELLRRVDPQQRTLGRFFRDEIARPLNLDFYIGTPADLPETCIARLKDFRRLRLLFHLRCLPRPFVRAMMNPRSLSARAFNNPRVRRPGDYARRPLRSLEIPAANGIGTARSIARAYSAFATGGTELGLKPETLQQLMGPAALPTTGRFDEVLRVETSYSLGYVKPFPDLQFGRSEKSFGTPGLGGSFAFADPEEQVGFAYVPNRLGFYLWNDPREKALREAVYQCLK